MLATAGKGPVTTHPVAAVNFHGASAREERARRDRVEIWIHVSGDLLVKKCGWKPGKRLQLRIRIAAEAGDRVIAFAYKQESPEARQAVLKELKEMLTRYLLP